MFLAVVVVVAAFMYRPSGGKTAAQVLGDTIVRTASGGNGNGNSGNGNGNSSTTDNGPHSFRVAGSFSGLYPGANGTLNVTVSNDENFAVVVETVSATVASVDPAHAACPLTISSRPTVKITTLTSAFQIAKNGSAQKQLAITMDGSAPDACSGATFTLQYGGSASKASQ
jgi:hypothetical protein